jgi:putative transposase
VRSSSTTIPDDDPKEVLSEWREGSGKGVVGGMLVRVSRKLLCRLTGTPRTSLYRKLAEPDTQKEDRIKGRLDCWHTVLPQMGSRKLVVKLREDDARFREEAASEGTEYKPMNAGRKLVRRYMREMGIVAVYPKPNLSAPGKGHKKHPYLLKDKSFIRYPNQVWAIDITYIKMRHGHMYLTAVIDWHSRHIVGWELSDTLGTAPVMDAVRAAMKRYGVPAIMNSDQGSQFTSEEYTSYLKGEGVRQSMDGKARWVDNVVMERWFRSFKTEWLYATEVESPHQLRRGIAEYVREYNEIRPHQSLGYRTPADVYGAAFTEAA